MAPNDYLLLSSAGLGGLAMLVAGGLSGWRGWLALKRSELDHTHVPATGGGAGARIEMADLKERIRKLEAIAAGVDL